MAGPGLLEGPGLAFCGPTPVVNASGSRGNVSNKRKWGSFMVKRIFAGLGLLAVIAVFASQAFAVEGVSERAQRKKMEAQKYPQQASEALQNHNPDLAIELFTKAIESKAFNDQPQTIGDLYY